METTLEILILFCLLSLALEDLRFLAVRNYKLLLVAALSLTLGAWRSSSLLIFTGKLQASIVVLLCLLVISFYEYKSERQLIGAADLLLLAALLPAWSCDQALSFLLNLVFTSALGALWLLIYNLLTKKAVNAWKQRFPLIPFYLLAYVLCQLFSPAFAR